MEDDRKTWKRRASPPMLGRLAALTYLCGKFPLRKKRFLPSGSSRMQIAVKGIDAAAFRRALKSKHHTRRRWREGLGSECLQRLEDELRTAACQQCNESIYGNTGRILRMLYFREEAEILEHRQASSLPRFREQFVIVVGVAGQPSLHANGVSYYYTYGFPVERTCRVADGPVLCSRCYKRVLGPFISSSVRFWPIGVRFQDARRWYAVPSLGRNDGSFNRMLMQMDGLAKGAWHGLLTENGQITLADFLDIKREAY